MKVALAIRAAWLAFSSVWGLGAATNASPTSEGFDSLLSPHFKANAPGAAIIVVKEGIILFRSNYSPSPKFVMLSP
ncbi:MAG: hypothetical protein PHE55_17180 [Methylococcaceae bacterium]|nr:hypothetical protein [Methylococcaceae bacterium]